MDCQNEQRRLIVQVGASYPQGRVRCKRGGPYTRGEKIEEDRSLKTLPGGKYSEIDSVQKRSRGVLLMVQARKLSFRMVGSADWL